jgi:hypothetical protein
MTCRTKGGTLIANFKLFKNKQEMRKLEALKVGGNPKRRKKKKPVL